MAAGCIDLMVELVLRTPKQRSRRRPKQRERQLESYPRLPTVSLAFRSTVEKISGRKGSPSQNIETTVYSVLGFGGARSSSACVHFVVSRSSSAAQVLPRNSNCNIQNIYYFFRKQYKIYCFRNKKKNKNIQKQQHFL